MPGEGECLFTRSALEVIKRGWLRVGKRRVFGCIHIYSGINMRICVFANGNERMIKCAGDYRGFSSFFAKDRL